MKFLAVIPAHNEANAIAAVVAAVAALKHDVLVIDDGSTDATAELAKKAGALVLSTGTKSGKGNALRLGFDYAVQKDYNAVIALDGDGQHDATDIAAFVEAFRKHKAGVVNGNRMHNPKGMPPVRFLTNGFMSTVISLICRQSIADTQCGFRLIGTEVLKKIRLQSTDFEIETEILIKASQAGFKIASVPVATIYRDEVSKIRPWRDTLRFIRYITGVLTKR